MSRLHIKKREKETKEDEKVDLDEKIRRIRENNKAREKRFKEVEDDKLKASDDNAHSRNSTSPKEKNTHGDSQGKTSMPRVLDTDGRNAPKGRGQRLREMSQQPLKAKAFERKALQGLSKMVEGNIDSQEGKDFTDHSISMVDRKAPYQRSLNEEKKMFDTSDIPSVGHNPLMDDRYTYNTKKDKPSNRTRERTTEKWQSKRNHSGFGQWSKMDVQKKQTEKVKKWERFKGNGSNDDKGSQKEFVSSGRIQRDMVFAEDWSAEIIDINNYNVGPVSENMPEVSKEAVQAGLYCDNKEVKELGLPNLDNNDDKETCQDQFKSEPNPDEIHQICETLQDRCQLPLNAEDGKDNNDNTKVHKKNSIQAGKVIQVIEEECYAKDTAEAEQHEHKLLKEEKSSATEETISNAAQSKKGNNKPKITINTKLKKTVSTSSLDENMSMLSPLDVPTNWGDCDFDDEKLEPIAF